jgi:glycosyltransferase involved in cell wall biosynthesis
MNAGSNIARVHPEWEVEPKDIHLALFLTRAVPLSRWEKMGILERECALYRRLRPHLGGLSIITSGGREELAFQEHLVGVRILYNRWGLSPNLYSLFGPLLHGSALREATVYKTNQLDGAWAALIAGRMHRRPVVVRAGYLWAEHFREQMGEGTKARLIQWLQSRSLRGADKVILTTQAMKMHVSQRYGVHTKKVEVIPNYVDTELFCPDPDVQPEAGRICYVGRLHPRKNIDTLIKAVAQVPGASLVVIGEGEQRQALEQLAARLEARVTFAGVIPHAQIPLELNRSSLFVLPSFFEGHPKVLIEAMACGCAVVGSDVQGTREVIRHGETGVVCPPTVEGFCSEIGRLLADTGLRAAMGQSARAFAVEEYGLDRIVHMELATLLGVHGG